jgi:hypothetical protein
VPIKEGKGIRKPTVGVADRGAEYGLVQRDGKWIEVEFYDYLAGETRSGWVAKKYFKMVRR